MKNTIRYHKKPDRIASLLLHSISRFDIRSLVDIVIVREMTNEIRNHRNKKYNNKTANNERISSLEIGISDAYLTLIVLGNSIPTN